MRLFYYTVLGVSVDKSCDFLLKNLFFKFDFKKFQIRFFGALFQILSIIIIIPNICIFSLFYKKMPTNLGKIIL